MTWLQERKIAKKNDRENEKTYQKTHASLPSSPSVVGPGVSCSPQGRGRPCPSGRRIERGVDMSCPRHTSSLSWACGRRFWDLVRLSPLARKVERSDLAARETSKETRRRVGALRNHPERKYPKLAELAAARAAHNSSAQLSSSQFGQAGPEPSMS